MNDLTTYQCLVLIFFAAGVWAIAHYGGKIFAALGVIHSAIEDIKRELEEVRSAVDGIQTTLDNDAPAPDQFDADRA